MYNSLYTPKEQTGTITPGLGLAVWPFRPFEPLRAFAAAVAVTGFIQIAIQYWGTRAILPSRGDKEKEHEKALLRTDMAEALNEHIHYMLQLFVICCGGPAMQNFFAQFGSMLPVGTPVAVPLAVPPLMVLVARMKPVYQRIYGTDGGGGGSSDDVDVSTKKDN